MCRPRVSNSLKRKVNKRKGEREKEKEEGMKNVRRPQESVAKVVAVQACTGHALVSIMCRKRTFRRKNPVEKSG